VGSEEREKGMGKEREEIKILCQNNFEYSQISLKIITVVRE
jgi:hypothetical protein